MARVWVIRLLCLTVMSSSQGGSAAQESPPSEEWIAVSDVSEEYAYVAKQRCQCGGSYTVERQSTGTAEGKHFDELFCKCKKCGKERSFTFDVTSLFEEYKIGSSEEAKQKVYAELDAKYPKVTKKDLPDLQALLSDRNPHKRSWAINALSKVGTAGAVEILLDGYLGADNARYLEYEDSLRKIGKPLLPQVERRLSSADPEKKWRLLSVLGGIKEPSSRKLLERELPKATEKLRRICCISLGMLAYKESEPILTKQLQGAPKSPDDALLWALGRCGTKKSAGLLRPYSSDSNIEVRAAAVVALATVEGKSFVPRLLELAEKDSDEGMRHAAIYALGQLKAKEAVPLLIRCLKAQPSGGASRNWPGIYGTLDDKADCFGSGGLAEVSIRALGKIGDKRAVDAFRETLRNDRYYLDFTDVASAAAAAGWTELVPVIVDRMEKDYDHNRKLFGPNHEQYAPALRALTGQKFSEDPKAWRSWLDGKGNKKKGSQRGSPVRMCRIEGGEAVSEKATMSPPGKHELKP